MRTCRCGLGSSASWSETVHYRFMSPSRHPHREGHRVIVAQVMLALPFQHATPTRLQDIGVCGCSKHTFWEQFIKLSVGPRRHGCMQKKGGNADMQIMYKEHCVLMDIKFVDPLTNYDCIRNPPGSLNSISTMDVYRVPLRSR